MNFDSSCVHLIKSSETNLLCSWQKNGSLGIYRLLREFKMLQVNSYKNSQNVVGLLELKLAYGMIQLIQVQLILMQTEILYRKDELVIMEKSLMKIFLRY